MFAWMVAELNGSATVNATMKWWANMSADIYVNQSEASVQELVSGVWNAVASEYNASWTMWEAAQTGGWGGGGATAAQIWSYATRTLTESAWLTTEQATQLEQVYDRVDSKVSEIAVWWNPYIEWVNGLKKWIQKIVDKVEDKGEEVKNTIKEEVKSIVIPEQKEPIVNITTQEVNTEAFIKEIKAIKPEVKVETNEVKVDLTPVLNAVKEIWKVSDIQIPEPKDIDMSWVESKLWEISNKIDLIPDNTETIQRIASYTDKEMAEEEEEMKKEQEKEIMESPLPKKFKARLK